MQDWIGLGLIVLIFIGAIVGLKVLSRPRSRTTEEFERSAAENTTLLGAGVAALNELMNPEAAKAKEVVERMKDGRYLKKKREGKAGGNAESEEEIL